MNTKKLLIIICILANQFINSANAQAPQSFNYQAVARDGTGAVLSNQSVSFRISLLQGSVTGTNVYSETHPVTTNQFGLVNFAIGGGTLVNGSFANINWAQGPYFVQVELDATGGSTYVIMNTAQLLSVPYAQFAEKSGNHINAGTGITISNDTITNTGDLSITNELQTLSISNDTVFLTNGGFAKLPKTGKNTLYLSGNLTDAQAAQRITDELGVNTQYIIINNCPNLTSLNLSAAIDIIDLKITNCFNLVTVNLSGLTNVLQDFTIDNTAITTLALNNLSKVNNNIQIHYNGATLSIPNLTGVYGGFGIWGGSGLTSILLPSLNMVYGNFSFYSNTFTISGSNISNIQLTNLVSLNSALSISSTSLTSLSLPCQRFVGGLSILCANLSLFALPNANFIGSTFRIASSSLTSFTCGADSIGLIENWNCPNLSSLSFPNLTYISSFTIGGLDGNLPSLASLTMPNLQTVVSNFIISNPTSLTSLSLPSLVTTSNNSFGISNQPSLQSVSIPNLASCYGISVTNNSLLNQINVSSLNSFSSFSSVGNKLNSTSINGLLSHFVSIAPSITGKSILLNNQNPTAPPTGQGVLNKQTLINNGNTVTTD
jgi:hypothetical protein